MEVRVKKLDPDVQLPKYETMNSSGMDVRANEWQLIGPGGWCAIATGLSVAIPHGYEIQVRPRSGLALKKGISVLNTPGTVDADYRGEIKVILFNFSTEEFVVNKGDRIAQLVVTPVAHADLVVVEELPESHRGEGGFGSTGTN